VNKQNARDRKLRSARRGAGVFARFAMRGAFAVRWVWWLYWLRVRQMRAPWRAQDKDGAGVTFSKQASSKEVGLPVYPGAKPHKDEKNDSPSVQMGIWGSTFGFKLAVMKLESNDAPEKVAEFYKKALAKYGFGFELLGAVSKDKVERFEQARVRR